MSIESLQQIVADESRTAQERQQAAELILGLSEPHSAIGGTGDDLRNPTEDFLNWRLLPLWERIPEPKPSFDKWRSQSDIRPKINRHDEAVAAEARKREFSPTGDPLKDMMPRLLLEIVKDEHSWRWEHPTYSAKLRMSIRPENYRLWGQE